nr:reverse transcriptase domain-containing protein [Tanacetum cinerariifolium]
MHAYDAIIPPQVLVLLPIIVPPSPMLSPIFNPQEFFVPEELLPPKKQTRLPSLSSTDLMPTKRTSTSAAPAMNQAAIRQLIDDRVAAALEAQAANMANTDNTNRNPKRAHVARKCSYKEFMSYQPFNFKSSKGAVGLIHWFECMESVFPVATAPKTARIEEAYKITWVEFKKLLIKKYCP